MAPIRGQAYRLDWQGEAKTLPEANKRLAGLWIKADEMIQTLFKRLKADEDTIALLEEEITALNALAARIVQTNNQFIISGDGEDGEMGIPGIQGVKGATGSAGAAGSSGAIGPPGLDGADGDDIFGASFQKPNGLPLTEVDDTNVTLTLSGSPSTALLNPTSLTLGWTGLLAVLRGGTGVNTKTGTGSVVLSDSPALTTSPTVPTQVTSDNSTKIASTAYVTTAIANAIAAVNPAVAAQAATTSASDTSSFTYNNGVSGIGATFTGTANTAVVIDGYTFTAVGQRLLIKNDTQSPSGAFNGLYYVTQIQTTLLPPIFTRALDYDQPSDINNTGAIPVINGTVNGTTTWVQTAQVNTVGTDPLAFIQFSFNPANVVTSITGTAGQITASASTGAVTLSLAEQLYATGTFTLTTAGYKIMSNHLTLTSSQRFTGAGTSRLRITT